MDQLDATTKRLCVFCGSSPGKSEMGKSTNVYLDAATSLGVALARANIPLVYGGGNSGLMGEIASSSLQHCGEVIGIIPSAFLTPPPSTSGQDTPKVEGQTSGFTSERYLQIETSSMHERKTIMSSASSGFIGLPGGYGTLEELAEMVTWSQLGIHRKPVVLLNVNNFYSPLRDFINGSISAGFISEKNRGFMIFLDSTEAADFDWGVAALAAIDSWEAAGAGGAVQLDLKWS